ncbi:hypothetical protein U9M48_014094 [Paspalum notatum var. saurae]|uniref:Uncharacterized protein n=1 Tax=Paspalum notatum var. saurae TaxID=547442 RepID=A0AAQ3T3J9_PASNO
MIAYMAFYLQDITARLGPDVNLPPFCPPQMGPQRGCHHPRARNHLRVDDGTTGLVATSRVDDGTPGLPDTSRVDGTVGLGAIFGVDGTAGLSASFGVDGTAGLPATFEVDASCCTILQPVDAITSSAIWITGFGLTPSWSNSRCGRA